MRTHVCVCVCVHPSHLSWFSLIGMGSVGRQVGKVARKLCAMLLVELTGQHVGKHDVWSRGETAGFVCFCPPTCLSLRLRAGPIPAELGSLSALVELDLHYNELSGE